MCEERFFREADRVAWKGRLLQQMRALGMLRHGQDGNWKPAGRWDSWAYDHFDPYEMDGYWGYV